MTRILAIIISCPAAGKGSLLPDVAKLESDFIQEFDQKPIWQSLDAVKADRAYFVGGHWWRAQTYLLANLVIDELFANLTDTTATTAVMEIQP